MERSLNEPRAMKIILMPLAPSSGVGAQTLNFNAAAEYSGAKRGQALLR